MCKVNGHPSIIEYYEMSEELANMRREDGELTYGFGVILNYLFSFNKLVEIANRKLPLHIVVLAFLIFEFFISTKFPILTPSPSSTPPLKRAKGPILQSFPIMFFPSMYVQG